jgi:hypothetical protein
MTKKDELGRPKRGGIDNSKQATPLYSSGRMNGPMGGPDDPPRTTDPLRYLIDPGMDAPGGSPSDSPMSATDAPPSHHGRGPGRSRD